MIVTEILTISGKEFLRTYSDSGYRIKKTGTDEVYDEAIDPVDSGRTYTETDEPIAEYITDETEAKARAYDILMGGE
jgi:hypothetical protein